MSDYGPPAMLEGPLALFLDYEITKLLRNKLNCGGSYHFLST